MWPIRYNAGLCRAGLQAPQTLACGISATVPSQKAVIQALTPARGAGARAAAVPPSISAIIAA